MATLTRERLKELVKEVMVEETEYQQFFNKALEKAGKSIPSMSDEEKKAFFNKIDAAWTGRGEKNEELVGNQHKLDVDKDGDIEADDLADLRAGKKVEEAADLRAIRMLIQNKGIKDAVRQHHADNLRKIIEDEGFSTKGVSDSELIKIAKILTNESVNEAKTDIKVGDMIKVVDNPHWEAAIGKKGPFKRKVKKIDHDNVFFTDGSNSSMKYIVKESVIKEGRYDADLDKIEAAVKNATSFMNVGAELKKAGIKYDFTTSMIPMYMIKVSGNTIAICNKKYAAGAEREVKDIAIGLLN